MKRRLPLILGLLIILSGCSAANTFTPANQEVRQFSREIKQDPPIDFIPKSISVVSVGDSLTQGVGDIQELGGYIPYLESKLESSKLIFNAKIDNFGVKGNRTDQLLKRLKQKNLQTAIAESDLVIITIGGNDVMHVFRENMMSLQLNKFSEAEIGYSKRLYEILKTIRTYNEDAGIVLLGIYNPFITWFSDIKEMNVVVESWNNASEREISKFDNAMFVPIADIFENNEESLLYTDYFHPNNRGYELIAERVYLSLEHEELLKSLFE